MMNHPAIELLCDLIKRKSVTPEDAGCQDILIQRLTAIGFDCEQMPFGDVSNFWARRGTSGPVLCFAGHTDVVPAGNLDDWSCDPFAAVVRGDTLCGRGAADMKGGIAAMLVAIEEFVAENPDHDGSLAMLITSDEEGPARDGTLKVIAELANRNEKIDWCVLGEPSSDQQLGDTVRIGRRGSLSALLTVRGIQGHVAYPQLADNPISRFAPVLAELNEVEWDQGNEFFPPTSFQVVSIEAGIGAPNVTPAELHARFNFRYSSEWDHDGLQQKLEEIFDSHDIDYKLDWHLSGKPFLTKPGKLMDAVSQAVEEISGSPPELSTGGGTSDGRFISPAGIDVVELGLSNATVHKVDEQVKINDVIALCGMYKRTMELLLLNA